LISTPAAIIASIISSTFYCIVHGEHPRQAGHSAVTERHGIRVGAGCEQGLNDSVVITRCEHQGGVFSQCGIFAFTSAPAANRRVLGKASLSAARISGCTGSWVVPGSPSGRSCRRVVLFVGQ